MYFLQITLSHVASIVFLVLPDDTRVAVVSRMYSGPPPHKGEWPGCLMSALILYSL